MLLIEHTGWLEISELNIALVSRPDKSMYELTQKICRELWDSSDSSSGSYDKWKVIALNTIGSQTHFFDVIMVSTVSTAIMRETKSHR